MALLICNVHETEHMDYGDKGQVCAFCVFDTAERLLRSADAILALMVFRLSPGQWHKLRKLVEDGKIAGFSFRYALMIVVARSLHLLIDRKQITTPALNASAVSQSLDLIVASILGAEES